LGEGPEGRRIERESEGGGSGKIFFIFKGLSGGGTCWAEIKFRRGTSTKEEESTKRKKERKIDHFEQEEPLKGSL